jgi:Alcohol dehydrogenase GroES-like domain
LKAIAIVPGRPESAGVIDLPEPPASDGSLLVQTLLIGMCGTDREIAEDGYGAPPPGEERLVLGHESLAEVIEAPEGSGFAPGDLIAGVVRRPDPLPCAPPRPTNGTCAGPPTLWSSGSRSATATAASASASTRVRRTSGAGPGRPRRAARADLGAGQGIRTRRAHWRTRLVRAEGRADHRRRADRAPRGPARPTTRSRDARRRPGHRGRQAPPGGLPGRPVPQHPRGRAGARARRGRW